MRWGTPAQKEDDVSGAGAYTHMTLLAESTEGMHNLFKLSSLASLEGYFRKPRMDRELLSRYAKGIIATTGCVGGEVQTRIRLGQYQQALDAAADFRDIFGRDNFYVELMHHELDIERRGADGLRRVATELNLPYLVTNDSHYTREADAAAHEVLLCVQTGTNMADPNRFRLEGNGYYLKTPQEMRALRSDEDWQSGCDNTLLVAERSEAHFTKSNLMPVYPLPDGETEASWMRKEVWRGMDMALPRRLRRAAPAAGRVRDGRHRDDGVLLVLPGRGRLHHVGEAERDQGRAGPGLRRGLDRGLLDGHH